MSDSGDDWFDKDIDEFVVKATIGENVEDISSTKADDKKSDDLSVSNTFFENGLFLISPMG